MRHVNKHNVAGWFAAIVCLIALGLAALAWSGLVRLDVSAEGLVTGWNLEGLKVLGVCLAAINVIAFVLFVWDKRVAVRGDGYGRRVSEARLLGLCLFGGSVGGLLAMYAVRHKTQKWYFVWGVPFFLLFDIALIVYAHLAGLL